MRGAHWRIEGRGGAADTPGMTEALVGAHRTCCADAALGRAGASDADAVVRDARLASLAGEVGAVNPGHERGPDLQRCLVASTAVPARTLILMCPHDTRLRWAMAATQTGFCSAVRGRTLRYHARSPASGGSRYTTKCSLRQCPGSRIQTRSLSPDSKTRTVPFHAATRP